MKRYVIDSFNDGHVAATTLTSIEGGGSAHDRKKRARLEASGEAPERKWSRADRKIFRNGIKEPVQIAPGVTLLPFGSEEMVDDAIENEAFTDAYVDFAAATAKEIEANNDAFAHDPQRCKIRKVKKIILVNEDETITVLGGCSSRERFEL